jgi:GNAT superfamily N-acetyltransferase
VPEDLSFHPVTPDRWPDLERLFLPDEESKRGEPSACWCMEWRRPRDEWRQGLGDGNRQAMRQYIDVGNVPGILAYVGGEPAAWCSISPRPQQVGLRAIAPYRNFDDVSVWLVSCFYIRDDARGRGLMSMLLTAAVEYATAHGARMIEGYPVDEQTEDPEQGLYMGRAASFRKLGFVEHARGAGNRAVMRLRVKRP